MLKNSFIQSQDHLTTHGFLISVEIEEGTSIEHLKNKLVDSLTWVEGVGKLEVTHMGEIDEYEKELDVTDLTTDLTNE